MANKKKKYNARFPPARIKKIMQKDDNVGKVAVTVPLIISRSLELFIEKLITKAYDLTLSKKAKTLSIHHLKQVIVSQLDCSFLDEILSKIPNFENTDSEAISSVSNTDDLTVANSFKIYSNSSTLNNDEIKKKSKTDKPNGGNAKKASVNSNADDNKACSLPVDNLGLNSGTLEKDNSYPDKNRIDKECLKLGDVSAKSISDSSNSIILNNNFTTQIPDAETSVGNLDSIKNSINFEPSLNNKKPICDNFKKTRKKSDHEAIDLSHSSKKQKKEKPDKCISKNNSFEPDTHNISAAAHIPNIIPSFTSKLGDITKNNILMGNSMAATTNSINYNDSSLLSSVNHFKPPNQPIVENFSNTMPLNPYFAPRFNPYEMSEMNCRVSQKTNYCHPIDPNFPHNMSLFQGMNLSSRINMPPGILPYYATEMAQFSNPLYPLSPPFLRHQSEAIYNEYDSLKSELTDKPHKLKTKKK